jgi:hypothetical protein
MDALYFIQKYDKFHALKFMNKVYPLKFMDE